MTQNKSDLDELVNDYQAPSKQTEDRLAELEKVTADRKLQDDAAADKQEYENAFKENIAILRDIPEIKHSDLILRGLVGSFADTDPDFAKAYNNRAKDPDAYKAAQENLCETAKKELTIDTSAAEVVQARLAADGHSNNEPVAEKYSKTAAEIKAMTAPEFAAFKATLL